MLAWELAIRYLPQPLYWLRWTMLLLKLATAKAGFL